MRFFQNGRCYPFLLLSWWPWRRPWVSIYQGQGFAFNKQPLQTNDFQVPSLTGLCVSKHIQNISCFNKFGISWRKSQSFHRFFPPFLNSRGHREFPHPWCSESRGGPGTLMQIRQLGLKVFLRISGHLCHTNRDDFVESFWLDDPECFLRLAFKALS